MKSLKILAQLKGDTRYYPVTALDFLLNIIHLRKDTEIVESSIDDVEYYGIDTGPIKCSI